VGKRRKGQTEPLGEREEKKEERERSDEGSISVKMITITGMEKKRKEQQKGALHPIKLIQFQGKGEKTLIYVTRGAGGKEKGVSPELEETAFPDLVAEYEIRRGKEGGGPGYNIGDHPEEKRRSEDPEPSSISLASLRRKKGKKKEGLRFARQGAEKKRKKKARRGIGNPSGERPPRSSQFSSG